METTPNTAEFWLEFLRFVPTWWLIAQMLGWLALPLSLHLFRWLPDRGYTFSKAVGLLTASYLLWLGASTGLLRNTTGGSLAALLLLAALSGWIYWQRQAELDLPAFLRQNRRLVISAELLFGLAFVAWALLRAYTPDKIMSAGGEKFMEIAFLNAILNSPSFPPLDPWMSGFAISYYYFGYVMMALVTRLSGATAGIGFDLYDALLFALSLLGAFGVVYNLTGLARPALVASAAKQSHSQSFIPPLSLRAQRSSLSRAKSQPTSPTTTDRSAGRAEIASPPTAARNDNGRPALSGSISAALLAALLLGVMGNLSGPFEAMRARGLLNAEFWRWLDIPGLAEAPVNNSWDPGQSNGWWWWRGSRVLQDYDLHGNPLGISPITEFPFFSFLLGDNHPHVMALPFALLAIAFALNLLIRTATHGPLLHLFPDISKDGGREGESLPSSPAGRGARGEGLLSTGYRLPATELLLSGAVLLGGLAFLNTWDFPIYFGLCLLAYAGGLALHQGQFRTPQLLHSALLAGVWFAGGLLLYIFFYTGFNSQAGGALPYIFPPTRLPQYLVMFGPLVFIAAAYLLFSLAAPVMASAAKQSPVWWVEAGSNWLWIMLAAASLIGLIILGIQINGWLAQQGLIEIHPNVRGVLGEMSMSQAALKIANDRLRDPGLFLLASALLALALTAALRAFLPQPSPSPLPKGEGTQTNSDGMSETTDPRLPTTGYRPPTTDHRLPATDYRLLSTGFTALLIFTAIALTWVVEFVYLRDSFGVRMNTIFKFYFQAWAMLACAGAYGLWHLARQPLRELASGLRYAALSIAVLLIGAGLVYPALAANSRTSSAIPPDLDGASGIARANPDDWAAIEWLQVEAQQRLHANQPVPVILEAPGKSYNYEGRISAFSGVPAVLGWAVHQSQWRGNYDEQGRREPDIEAIYSDASAEETLALLRKWGVDYVIVGPAEQRYIQNLCLTTRRCNPERALQKFPTLLQPVFQSGQTTIYLAPGALTP
jgi:uncharacterized membrane protein